MEERELQHLVVNELLALGRECEWIEWKRHNSRTESVGHYLSGLASSAALHDKNAGYIVWGISNPGGRAGRFGSHMAVT